MSKSFWSDSGRRTWPRDPHGYVFLGRSVDRIGAAMHGDAWALSDPAAVYIEDYEFDLPPTPEEASALKAHREAQTAIRLAALANQRPPRWPHGR